MPMRLSHRFALASAAVSAILFSPPTQAQIVPDATLGTQVFGVCGGTGGACGIINGTTRGSNLFHSFQQFSLPNGDLAAFITNPTIQNVIVRVTGVGHPFISNINGAIATFDPAFNLAPRNFFLLNPNGIVFGPGATLLNGGSFLSTTAERMLFQDGTVFDTRDRIAAPLLTVSVPVGLQFGQAPGAIWMQGVFLSAGNTNRFSDFALVGGDVTLDDSIIYTSATLGRRVELGGVGENGTVELRLSGDRLSLSFAAGIPRRDISLINESSVDASASTGGSEVVVTGRNVVLGGKSSIWAGILPGVGNAVTNQAGDIKINANATLQLTENSFIDNSVDVNAIGQGGNLNIAATDIQLHDGSTIAASTLGNGNAGNVKVAANSITLDGTTPDGQSVSGIFSRVFSTSSGRSGDITIETSSLTVANGAAVSASTFGNGKAGNVWITANSITLDGTTPNGQGVSGISSQVELTGSGNGGDITIETGSLSVTNGAGVSASTLGNGDGGNVQITANSIALDGTTPNGQSVSGIFGRVLGTGSGHSGDVTIETGSLAVTNGAAVSASTSGNGNGGNVRVTANSIALDGTTPGQGVSGIDSQVDPRGKGRGGDIIVKTGSLTITNGAKVTASTLGNGNGGNVRVTANSIAIDGTAPTGDGSGIGSVVGSTGRGHGGDVAVETGSLAMTNGAAITAGTLGNGDGGNVQVRANTITLNGTTPNGQSVSGIGSQVDFTGRGRGGNVTVEAGSLTVTNGAGVSSSAFGIGGAGDLDITSRSIQLDRGFITATSVSGDGGNINLNVGDLLLLRRGSRISTTAGNEQFGGNGGNITIDASKGFIVGVKGENSDITANAFTGSGGRVNITTQGIYGLQFRPKLTEFSDITASSTFGVSGVVAINTLGIDPSRGLQQLPGGLVDPSNRIDQKCAAGSGFRRSSFTVTGRGGLPENPLEPLQSAESVASWVEVETENTQPSSSTQNLQRQILQSPSPLIEADGLMVDKDGSVQLVASQSMAAPSDSWHLPTCASDKERDR